MNYNKTNWFVGDVITADKLNNIEDYLEQISDSQESDTDVTSILFYNVQDYGIMPDTGDNYSDIYDLLANKVYDTGGLCISQEGSIQ